MVYLHKSWVRHLLHILGGCAARTPRQDGGNRALFRGMGTALLSKSGKREAQSSRQSRDAGLTSRLGWRWGRLVLREGELSSRYGARGSAGADPWLAFLAPRASIADGGELPVAAWIAGALLTK
jgi:hypothetical protein